MSIKQVNIEILGRNFAVNTPESEQQTLLKAVSLLNGKIDAIKGSGKIADTDKLVIMAALNLTHDLLKSPPQNSIPTLADDEVSSTICQMIQLCEQTVKA